MNKRSDKMFHEFEKFFNISISDTSKEYRDALVVFRDKYQGKDFGEGLYRVFSDMEVTKWKEIITEAYPDFAGKFEPFAFDWLGRCFAIDLRNNTMANILMFEIGTADVLEIPCDLSDFSNVEIPNYSESCLASNFYKEWKEAKKQILEHSKCAGYKIPLFLGGDDEISNLELCDMDVYWFICSSAKLK